MIKILKTKWQAWSITVWYSTFQLVLWHCWLGDRKDLACKKPLPLVSKKRRKLVALPDTTAVKTGSNIRWNTNDNRLTRDVHDQDDPLSNDAGRAFPKGITQKCIDVTGSKLTSTKVTCSCTKQKGTCHRLLTIYHLLSSASFPLTWSHELRLL